MNKKYVLNFDDVNDEFESTYELAPPPEPVSGEIQEKYDAALNRALARFSGTAEGIVGSEYRFVAECESDAVLFMHAISAYVEQPWTVTPDDSGFDMPDVEVQFRLKKEISPRSLLWAAIALVDGHIIVQALGLAEDYTGERDMDLNSDIDCVALLPSEEEMGQMFMSSSRYAERMQCLADQAEDYASGIFGVLGTAYTSRAPANDDADWFEGMLKLNA